MTLSQISQISQDLTTAELSCGNHHPRFDTRDNNREIRTCKNGGFTGKSTHTMATPS